MKNNNYLGDISLHIDAIKKCILEDAPDSVFINKILQPFLLNLKKPLTVLPIGCCAAVGGNPGNAVPIAAVWELTHLIMRVLDDLQDKDRSNALWERIGEAQTYNFCSLLYVQSINILNSKIRPSQEKEQILSGFIKMSRTLLEGQEIDIIESTLDFDSYWNKIEKKNAVAFSWGCLAGAKAGSINEEHLKTVESFGYHLGVILQLFDDYQGIWSPNGKGDLKMGKYTLPLIFGLVSDSTYKEKLKKIAGTPAAIKQNTSEIEMILNKINAKGFLIWTAIQEKKKAIELLEKLPSNDGSEFLSNYIEEIFSRIGN